MQINYIAFYMENKTFVKSQKSFANQINSLKLVPYLIKP